MAEQRKNFHLAAILRVQLDMPGLAQLHRHGGGELARLRGMRRYKKSRYARLLARGNAAFFVGRTEQRIHGVAASRSVTGSAFSAVSNRTGIERKWSKPAGKGVSSPPTSSGAIQTDCLPWKRPAITSSAKRAIR